jgi:hypothetical protein
MSIVKSNAKFDARVARGDQFLATATSEQLDLLSLDYDIAFDFFKSSPLLFGDDCWSSNQIRDTKTIKSHFILLLKRAVKAFPNRRFQHILDKAEDGRGYATTILSDLCSEIAEKRIPFLRGTDALAECTTLHQRTQTNIFRSGRSCNRARALIYCKELKKRLTAAHLPTSADSAFTPKNVTRLVTALNRRARLVRMLKRRSKRASHPPPQPAQPADTTAAQRRLLAWSRRSPARAVLPDADFAKRLTILLGRAHKLLPAAETARAAAHTARIARQGESDLHNASIVSFNISSAHAHLAATLPIVDQLIPTLFPSHNRSADVLILQETQRNAHTIARPFGYTMFEQPRANEAFGGGTAIFVRSHLPAALIQTASHQSNGVDEAEWLTVKLDTHPLPTYLVSVYRPPLSSHSNDSTLSDLLLAQLRPLALSGTLIVGCDLNADWDCPRPSDRHQTVQSWKRAFNVLGLTASALQLPSATRTTRRQGNAIIDYLYTARLPAPLTRCYARDLGHSDHYALIAHVPKLLLFVDPPIAANWRKATDDPAQMDAIANLTIQLMAAQQPKTASELIDIANTAALQTVGPTTSRAKSAARTNTWRKAGWWTAELTALENSIRRHHRRITELQALMRHRKHDQLARLTSTLAQRRGLLKTDSEALSSNIRAAKTKYFTELRTDLNPSYAPDVEKAHRMLRSFTARAPTKSIPFKIENMTAKWTDIMGPVLPRDQYDPTDKYALFRTTIDQLRRDQPEYALEFTTEEISAAIRKLPLGKAPGPDKVPNAFWRAFGARGPMHDWLAAYVRDLLKHPDRPIEPSLQIATAILIPKKDAPANETDYRPISLLNTIAKLIEQIIFERIKPRLEGPDQLHAMSNDLYAPISPLEQAGFTTGRSTIQQALLTRLAREHAARNHTDLYITGYDQAKAFDSAQWIEIVLSMAQSKRWHWRECSFALAWMTGQTRRLLVNGTLSEPITVTRGVPQGGILSPTLYNEHVRTLATKINSLSLVNPAPITKRVNITDTFKLSVLIYADDLNTLTTTPEDAIKCYQHAAVPWSTSTASKFNTSKTEYIKLSMPYNARANPAPLQLDASTKIEHSTTFRLLGVHLHTSNPNHIQPLAINGKTGKPAVQSKVARQPNILSPRAGATPRLSATIMRTSIEQSMLFSAGVAKIDTKFATRQLAAVCKHALGAHVSMNNMTALSFCGVPTAEATQLKLQLSLIYNSTLLHPIIKDELRRPIHADDLNGLTWRSVVASSLYSLYPRSLASSPQTPDWAWRLMLSALETDTWQPQILDPITQHLWPTAHDAYRLADHDAVGTWRFFNNRFVYCFNVPLTCPLCRSHPLKPLDMLNSCTAPAVLALCTQLGNLPHFSPRARTLISEDHYIRLTYEAIFNPRCKTINAAQHVLRLPGDTVLEHELNVRHVAECVVRHAASVHSRLWSLVEIYVKDNARRLPRAPRAAAAAQAAPGADQAAPAAPALAAPAADDDEGNGDDPDADNVEPAAPPAAALPAAPANNFALLPGVANAHLALAARTRLNALVVDAPAPAAPVADAHAQAALEARAEALIAEALAPPPAALARMQHLLNTIAQPAAPRILDYLRPRRAALGADDSESESGADCDSVPPVAAHHAALQHLPEAAPACDDGSDSETKLMPPAVDAAARAADRSFDSAHSDGDEVDNGDDSGSKPVAHSSRSARLARELECSLSISPLRLPSHPLDGGARRSLRIAARDELARSASATSSSSAHAALPAAAPAAAAPAPLAAAPAPAAAAAAPLRQTSIHSFFSRPKVGAVRRRL